MAEKISCSVCGGSLTMSKDGCTLQCQECGIVYPIEFVRTHCSVTEIAEPAMKQASGASAEFDSGAPQDLPLHSESSEEEVARGPLLSAWKTSYGFSALGLFVGLLICTTPILGIAGLAMLACWWLGAMIYAFSIYPSFFSSAPKLHSSQTISFFNLLFGGAIFGCIWNSNLSNGKKGFSHIVYQVVGLISFIAMVAAVYFSDPFHRISDPGNQEVSQKDGCRYWFSDAIYPDGENQYDQVVNDHLCWELTRFALASYDEMREWWWDEANVQHDTDTLSQEVVDDYLYMNRRSSLARALPAVGDKCSYSTSHIGNWRAYKRLSVDGKEYKVGVVHVFFHDEDGESQHVADRGAPWFLLIIEVE